MDLIENFDPNTPYKKLQRMCEWQNPNYLNYKKFYATENQLNYVTFEFAISRW